ncbi:Glycoside hydrolase precursor family 13 [Flavobacterium indicum GPTSA100-9 = DSM 17447]|uniref:Glycoside hydrolase family 13 n=1 Tax=Flavobacterium indicum (strain DSM 17447 / CIP 109464 / GPTSA100-9) TaxID=1094466 RepID=H8XNT9_FLAIG|nr:alpha-amylase family glycosyl hydrolase [Flavobacterium indicum]CCG52206.1 Glycoside hydrolase precursor family 13 [Flavobacterium indicum GPTSA100-9 = DSM 17447]
MKKIYSLLLLLFYCSLTAQVSWQGGTTPEANQTATILFDKTGTGLASYSGTIYAHTGVTLNGTPWQNVIGSWGNNTTQPALTLVSGNIYKLDLTPTILNYYGVSSGTVSKINIVFRSNTGAQQTTDLELNVGAYQATLTAPNENSTTLLNSGQNLSIAANNTNGNANYNLFANGVSIHTYTGTSYSYTDSNITANKSYDLQITQGATTYSKKFSVIINPGTISQALPAGMEIGINYNTSDATKATLVLEAPGKDFVYVAGTFNNWQPSSSYAMKKDPTSGKFWLELTGLTSGTEYLYQYWVVDTTPIANSPTIVKTADPCSTLVLSSFDDPYIPATSYPGLMPYPNGQDREVTVLQTGQTAYPWVVTNFTKPSKDKLVVYELLVRDFDSDKNYQDVIDKIDYFKNLGINAIELMPVMEFEGNESWGYNTAFHMALDKFYGNKNKLKELIDLCHQNGIAVILDIAFNHAFGRNPMVRMWMNDPDGDGWGSPSTENPYFNTVAKHSYSVGEDFNHSSNYTKDYVKRTVKHWITEFKIDGFRWDLTKGFTQNCTAGDDACTNAYQADRVAVLKEYADYTWSLDNDHYVIFEHLGTDSEEQQWANYRIAEGKGIMMWGELYEPYKQLALGFSTNGDITRMGHVSRGFTGKRLMGYPESHDKDRLMYQAYTYGNSAGTAPVGGNLNNALNRMPAVGATSILIPGPKMIWHFQELGMDDSIFTCNNGTVNSDVDAIAGDCKLDTKPQPQWVENWLTTAPRSTIYSDYVKFIKMKKNDPVFNGDYTISPNGSNIRQRIYIYDNSLPSTQLKNVVILANYSVAAQNITPDFPYTGTWYNLMTNAPLTVTSTTAQITLNPGEYRIYGNQVSAALANEAFEFASQIELYPNPAQTSFVLTNDVKKLDIYSITGQLIKSANKINALENINISDLSKGVYLVKIETNESISISKKLIKE